MEMSDDDVDVSTWTPAEHLVPMPAATFRSYDLLVGNFDMSPLEKAWNELTFAALEAERHPQYGPRWERQWTPQPDPGNLAALSREELEAEVIRLREIVAGYIENPAWDDPEGEFGTWDMVHVPGRMPLWEEGSRRVADLALKHLGKGEETQA